MKKIIEPFLILLIIINTTKFTLGQQKIADNIAERIRYNILTNFKPDRNLNDSCVNTVVFLKFKINNGKIDSLELSSDNSLHMKNTILRDILATNRQWILTEGEKKQASGKLFLLPFFFFNDVRCSTMMITKKGLKKNDLPTNVIPDTFLHKALINMLNFEKEGKFSMLQCFLINPIYYANSD